MSLTFTTPTWESTRLRAHNAQLAINGTTLVFNGKTITALCPQKEQLRQMMQADFLGRRDARFTIKRTDYVELGITEQSTVESCETKFQVTSILDDDSEPTVDLNCRLLQ